MSGKRGRPPKVREDQWLMDLSQSPPDWLIHELEAIGHCGPVKEFNRAKGWSAAAGENVARSKRFDPLFPESWWRQCVEYARDQQRSAVKNDGGRAKGRATTVQAAGDLRNHILEEHGDLLRRTELSHARVADLVRSREEKRAVSARWGHSGRERTPSQLRKVIAELRASSKIGKA